MQVYFFDLASLTGETPASVRHLVTQLNFQTSLEGPFIIPLLRPSQAEPDFTWHVLVLSEDERVEMIYHDPDHDHGYVKKFFDIPEPSPGGVEFGPVLTVMFLMGLEPKDVFYLYDDDLEGDGRYRREALELLMKDQCIPFNQIAANWPSSIVQ